VVDLHAVTAPHDPIELRKATRQVAALYLAAGVDPDRSTVFVQSHVPSHAELGWLLTTQAPVGWLQRMVQYKDKTAKQRAAAEAAATAAQGSGGAGDAGVETVGAGLLTYPCLMAADILCYQADLVPVGEDQRQHLELTRDLAARMNDRYGGKRWKKLGGRGGRLFTVPDALVPPRGARVMSLQDGRSKMSKSDPNDKSRLNLLDSPDDIVRKVKAAKTDMGENLATGLDDPDRPEAANLLTLYGLATGKSREEVTADTGALRWGEFKPLLAEAVVEHLRPIQARYAELAADEAALDMVLAVGAERADATARRTLRGCYEAMGFVPRPSLYD